MRLNSKIGNKALISSQKNIQNLTKLGWSTIVFFAILQSLFFPTASNIIAVSFVVLSWWIMTTFFFNVKSITLYPFSTFLIICFSSTQFFFPLIFTSIETKPITFNLKLPDEVFLHSLLALCILLLTHYFYRYYNRSITNSIRRLLLEAHFFYAPNNFQLWAMGFIGLFSMFYVYIFAKSALQVTGEASDKFIESLINFTYAPYFIPFGKLFGKNDNLNKNYWAKLLIFTLLLLIVSIARNSRGSFMVGLTLIGLAYCLGILMGVFNLKLFTFKNILIITTFVLFFNGPLADLSTAMVVVRGQRSEISSSELFYNTLKAYGDKFSIKEYRVSNKQSSNLGWDEYYLDNIFLARFANIKYNDMSLIEYSKISNSNLDYQEFSLNRLWAILPQPILKLLGISIDKQSLLYFSFGDYLHVQANANADEKEILGGLRSGHFSGTGMAAFGWWYLLILAILMIPVYILFDSFFLRIKAPDNISFVNENKLSFCGLLALTSIFNFLPNESVIVIVSFLLRGWVQMTLIYYLIFHLTLGLSIFAKKI